MSEPEKKRNITSLDKFVTMISVFCFLAALICIYFYANDVSLIHDRSGFAFRGIRVIFFFLSRGDDGDSAFSYLVQFIDGHNS